MKEKKDDITLQIEDLKRKIKSRMPHIRKEIKVYERHIALGLQNKNPEVSPQFK